MAELLDTVLRHEKGALPSIREVEVLDVEGIGKHPYKRLNLESLTLEKTSLRTAEGTVEIDGNQRRFLLSFPEKLIPASSFVAEPGELSLLGTLESHPDKKYIVATVRFA